MLPLANRSRQSSLSEVPLTSSASFSFHISLRVFAYKYIDIENSRCEKWRGVRQSPGSNHFSYVCVALPAQLRNQQTKEVAPNKNTILFLVVIRFEKLLVGNHLHNIKKTQCVIEKSFVLNTIMNKFASNTINRLFIKMLNQKFVIDVKISYRDLYMVFNFVTCNVWEMIT